MQGAASATGRVCLPTNRSPNPCSYRFAALSPASMLGGEVVARLSTFEGPPDAIDRMREDFNRLGDELQEMKGFEEAYLLVDRDAGRAVAFTRWYNRAALEASTEKSDEVSQLFESASQYL